MKRKLPTGDYATKKAENFKKWLIERGAELIEVTNEWEVVRFKTGKGVSILYRSKDGAKVCSAIGEAETAWHHFSDTSLSPWRAIPATKRKATSNTTYENIRKRDGILCFFCACEVKDDEATIEHLVPLTLGGPNHISNKFIAHAVCNNKAGILSAPEKIAIYYQVRLIKYIRSHNLDRRPNNSESDGNIAQASGSEAREISV